MMTPIVDKDYLAKVFVRMLSKKPSLNKDGQRIPIEPDPLFIDNKYSKEERRFVYSKYYPPAVKAFKESSLRRISLEYLSFDDSFLWPREISSDLYLLLNATDLYNNPHILVKFNVDDLKRNTKLGFARINNLLLEIEAIHQDLQETTKPSNPTGLVETIIALSALPELNQIKLNDIRYGRLLKATANIHLDDKDELLSTFKSEHLTKKIYNQALSAIDLHNLIKDHKNNTVCEEIESISESLVYCSIGAKLEFTNENIIKRSIDMFSQKYGIYGSDNTTLETIGKEHKITRERSRQIIAKTTKVLERKSVSSSIFIELARRVERLVPASIESINLNLRSFLGPVYSISSASSFASDVLRMPFPAIVDKSTKSIHKGKLLVCHSAKDWLSTLHYESVRMITRDGAANTILLAQTISEKYNRLIPHKSVCGSVNVYPGIVWLDKENIWFWLNDDIATKNRVITAAMKILHCATEPISISELYQGVITSLYKHGTNDSTNNLPPPHILQRLFIATEEIKNTRHNYFFVLKPNPKKILSNTHLSLYNFFVKRKGIVSKQELNEALVNTGVLQSNTLATSLSYTPFIKKIDSSIYMLRGWPYNTDRLKDAFTSRDKHLYPEANYDKNGRVIIMVSVTLGNLNNYKISIPTHLTKNVKGGIYTILNHKNVPTINLVLKTRIITGAIAEVKYIGAEPGDTMRLYIDDKKMEVEIILVKTREDY